MGGGRAWESRERHDMITFYIQDTMSSLTISTSSRGAVRFYVRGRGCYLVDLGFTDYGDMVHGIMVIVIDVILQEKAKHSSFLEFLDYKLQFKNCHIAVAGRQNEKKTREHA